MIHNKGKLLLRLAALVAAVGISLVLVAHVALADGGTITIEKQTEPPGGTGFEFTDDIEAPNNFTLDHGGTRTFTNVISGTYTITETNPAVIPGGWILTDVDCWAIDDDLTWTYKVASMTVTIQLTNQEVECIFTNERLPPPPVGGYVIPVNKLELLAPWLALVAMASFAALTVALVKRRRA